LRIKTITHSTLVKRNSEIIGENCIRT